MPTYGSNIADNIASYVQTIYESATLVARENNFITSLVLNFNDTAGTATRSRSEYGTVTFNSMSDADDLASQVFTPSVANSISPAFYGAQFFITDRRRRTDPMGVLRDASMELGQGAAKSVQKAVVGNFASLTGGTVGSAGGTLTWGDMFKAVSYLKRENAPEPYYAVLETGQWFHLGTAVVPAGAQTNAPNFQDAVMNRWWVASVGPLQIFVTSDITSGTAADGGIFSRSAIAYDTRKGFGIEPERDASRGGGGYELNATMEYAHGVWRPKWGVRVTATSVLP